METRQGARGGRGRAKGPVLVRAVPVRRKVPGSPRGAVTRKSLSPPRGGGDVASRSTSSSSSDSPGPPVDRMFQPLSLLLKLSGQRLAFCSALYFAAFSGVVHWYHISNLFENDRHFSHLSTLEREMSFRTEMGLYYSFFKTIIEAPSFCTGLWDIMYDTRTEYPLVINALQRFNVYPEVVLAALYRLYRSFGEFIGFQTKNCWTVNRGYGLSSVESCVGMGDPAYFYVNVIFVLNGLVMSLFFLYGAYLSMSRLGGLVTVLCIFYNHGECTRVMWTPPLRESFSYPFFVLQMFIVTRILRDPDFRLRSWFLLLFANVSFMISWQFAQFALLTQILCLFAVYIIGFLNSEKMLNILLIHMGSLVLCWILMLGNCTLLTSYYAYCLSICLAITAAREQFFRIHENEVVTWVLQVAALGIGTCILKLIIPKVSDDAHITNLIWSKITDYKDFHTLMYTCAAEFDFMEGETPFQYAKTLLLPVVVIVFASISLKTLDRVLRYLKLPPVRTFRAVENRKDRFVGGELVYHALQLVAFALLAIFIMRFKLFLTPHMCIMASLICSRQMFRWFPTKRKHELFVIVILMSMSIQGIENLRSQWNIMGEFSNVPQEELLEWLKFNTKPNAVFAGTMPTMASVKLSTGRPIVIHPLYENADLRAKTKIVYSVYSRKPVNEVKTNLLKLGVNYCILEESWCARKIKLGCSMPEIWDVEDPINAGKTPLCAILCSGARAHFSIPFQNNMYKVLKIVPDV